MCLARILYVCNILYYCLSFFLFFRLTFEMAGPILMGRSYWQVTDVIRRNLGYFYFMRNNFLLNSTQKKARIQLAYYNNIDFSFVIMTYDFELLYFGFNVWIPLTLVL